MTISYPYARRAAWLLSVAVAASATAWAANIAPAGTGILGVNDAIDADAGTPRFNGGVAANINDDDIGTRVDTWFGSPPTDQGQGISFVGILWPYIRYDQVETLTLHLATFADGGWFGVNGETPEPGGFLTPEMLIEPSVQVTSDGGVTWTTVPHTSDYLTWMNGHSIGGGGNANPTQAMLTFTLDDPPTEIDGIRIIGENGGNAGPDANGFLGVFELAVQSGEAPDTDADGLPDHWEEDNGFTVGTNEGADDPDSDGLPNTGEYQAASDPHVADTDEDGLDDGTEVNASFTNPLLPDTDGDGLTDGEEQTHGTDPILPDSDLDGLSDYDEVEVHGTDPWILDTDFDTFDDALEVAQGSDPTNALSVPSNQALFGRAIMGLKPSMEGGIENEMEYYHVGVAENLNDGDPATRVDTWNNTGTETVSFVGAVWLFPVTEAIESARVTFATFVDGGWFGPNGTGPGSGGALTADHLVEPEVQISNDGGSTWTTVPHTSDYIEKLTGHRIGTAGGVNPTFVTATFTLDEPAEDILGIRVIGTEGGTASGGFIGVSEFEALAASSDTDNDRMDDAWERQNGLNVGEDDAALDPDEDGRTNLQEYEAETNPQEADTDADGLTDGEEASGGTDALKPDTDGDGVSDGDETNTHGTDPLDLDTDDDGFNDGMEVGQGTDPADAGSSPSNIAPLGTAIIGTTESIEAGPYTPWANAGSPASINDLNLTTRVDTFNGANPGIASYVGIIWEEPVALSITALELTLATFLDGGWFGPNAAGPGAGLALAAEHLTEPEVQVSTDGGATWTTAEQTSDYIEQLTGHLVGGNGVPNPSTATARFEFATPQTGIDGVRIIGTEGGTASGGFLGVFELAVETEGGGTQIGTVELVNTAVADGQFTFEFESINGASHVVEFKNALDDAEWQTLETITGDGAVKQVTDAIEGTLRLYRVRNQ